MVVVTGGDNPHSSSTHTRCRMDDMGVLHSEVDDDPNVGQRSMERINMLRVGRRKADRVGAANTYSEHLCSVTPMMGSSQCDTHGLYPGVGCSKPFRKAETCSLSEAWMAEQVR